MAEGGRVTIEYGVTFVSGGGRDLECDVYTPPGDVTDAPAVLLADEPTGNLDRETADQVFEELVKVLRSTSSAALIATHNPDPAQRMDRTGAPKAGVLV